MEVKGFLTSTLVDMERRLNTTLEGLSAQELTWRPGPECHSIGFALWHLIRAEDFWLQGFILRQAELYESEGWAQKLGTPPRDNGYRYTAAQLASFPVPPLEKLQAYGKSVRHHTLALLRQLPMAKLDEKYPSSHIFPQRPEMSIGDVFQHVILELTLHIGQITYLRGMQRGLDK